MKWKQVMKDQPGGNNIPELWSCGQHPREEPKGRPTGVSGEGEGKGYGKKGTRKG